MIPIDADGTLKAKAECLLENLAQLKSQLHLHTLPSFGELIQHVDAYSYALLNHDCKDLTTYMMLSSSGTIENGKAFEKVAEKMKRKILKEGANPYDGTFIKWLHMELYTALPEACRHIELPDFGKIFMITGEYRTSEKGTNGYIAPYSGNLFMFISKYEQAYSQVFNVTKSRVERLLYHVSAYHRFMWMQPFLDGNRKIALLILQACLIKDGWYGDAIWSLHAALQQADAHINNALKKADATTVLEGSEQLSALGLSEYVEAVIDAFLQHTALLCNATSSATMIQNINAFVDAMQFKNKMPYEANAVLEQVWLKGTLPRMELLRITGKSDKTAKKIADFLLNDQLLVATNLNKFSPYSMGFPLRYVPFLFSGLLNQHDELMLFKLINSQV